MGQTVLVVTSDVPFVNGGHRIIARELVAALAAAGHRAELVRTPSNRFGRNLSAYLANWLTDVGETGYGEPVDRVISLRWPAYAVRHPRHVAWVIHRMREYYDLWDRFAPGLSLRARVKEEVRRRIVHAADRWLLTENVRRVYCISDTVRGRLERWGGIPATTLHPPAPRRPYRAERHEPFVLAVSRLHRWKRIDLVVDAVAGVPGLRAVVAGDGPERAALEARAAARGAAGRIRFAGEVADEELLDLYSRAACVCFPPYQEDYGFVTVEAFASRRPVVTASDSGGAAELVRDGVNGLVTAPEPQALGEALERLVSDLRLAEKLGEAGHATHRELSWEATVARLLGDRP